MIACDSFQEDAAKFDNSANHFFRVLSYHDLFAGNQSQDRVRRLLDKLNKVCIDGEWLIVELCELNHLWWYAAETPPLTKAIGILARLLQ
jgi:hypothetical protein